MSTQITGTIKVIKDTQQVTEKFAKREVVITTLDGQYSQDIMVQFRQDKCPIMDGYKLNESVTVDVNIRGRLWTSPQGEDKYFVSLDAWKIAKTEGGTPSNSTLTPLPASTEESADDDLPF